MNKIIYLVDTENVKWVDLLNVVTSNEKIMLFHSQENVNMSYKELVSLSSKIVDISHEETVNGSENALDFQLLAVLGLMMNKEDQFIIVAKDTGYDAAIVKYVEKGYFVRRLTVEEVVNMHKQLNSKKKKREKDLIEKQEINNAELQAELPEPTKNIETFEIEIDNKKVVVDEYGDIKPKETPLAVINLENEQFSELKEMVKMAPVKEVKKDLKKTPNPYYKITDIKKKERAIAIINNVCKTSKQQLRTSKKDKLKKIIFTTEYCEHIGKKINNILSNEKKTRELLDSLSIYDSYAYTK